MSHVALLKRLTNSPKSMKMFSHGDTANSQMSFHFPRYLKEMEEAGYVFEQDELWHISKLGRDYLDSKTSTVAGGERFTTWKTNDVYTGSELKNKHTRPGCYDYLNCKSLVQGRLVERTWGANG